MSVIVIAPDNTDLDKRRQFQEVESRCRCGSRTVQEHRKLNVHRWKQVPEDW
jgi:hypothetical protein